MVWHTVLHTWGNQLFDTGFLSLDICGQYTAVSAAHINDHYRV